jgi:preprotein translocase subunit SecG
MTPDSILELFGSSGVENVLRLNTGKLVAVMFILEVVHEIKINAQVLNKTCKVTSLF